MTARRTFPVLGLIVLALFAAPFAEAQCVSLTTLGSPSTQNFTALANAGTNVAWTDNSTIPGWYSTRTTYNAGTGSSNTGSLYSFGVAGVNALTDRALGGVGSGGTGTFYWAGCFTNNTGSVLTSVDIAYLGEQWRDGGAVTPVSQTMAVEYQVAAAGTITDADTPTTGWTAAAALDFTSPTFTNTGAGVLLDGNAAANRTAKAATITVSVPIGNQFWIRWRDLNDAGNDHGLAVDDFSVTPQGGANAPVVPTCATPLTTTTGTATSEGVSATDADGTVTSATITGITPSDPGTITLTGFTPAGGVGGTANATLSVSAATPANTYSVTIQWANNDGVPQTANCVVSVVVNAPPVVVFIHDVQGNGAATPIPGATVTIEGVVTGDFQPIPNDNRLSGFFVQEEDLDFDADPATSEGIFVFCSACPTNVAEGQKVQVTGTVSEFNNLTEITATTGGSVVITNAGNNLAQVSASTIDLPVVGVIDDFYEPRESMLVHFVDPLTVSEYFEQARYGRIELYEGTRPRTFNESNPPSVAGFAAHNDNLNRRRVYLDDDDNVENSVLNLPDGQQFVFHPQSNGGLSVGTQGTDFFRGGDTINSLTGILHFSFSGGTSPNEWRVRPVAASPATFTAVNVRPASPPAVGGAIRAASVNVLNYFTTLNVRGADSTAELNRQRERTAIVLCALNADVAALMEIENHATNATITDLLTEVNTRCGAPHPYTFVNTGGALGTDQIRVLLIYRTGVLSPVGSPLSDMDGVHNRPPTAQTFDVVDATNPAFGQRFTALANHSKSKGCGGASGADLDQNDGQACFAATRLAQANRIISWVNGTVVPAAGDPDVLMLGDFNAYPQETASTAITGAGFSDLETAFLGSAAYSYLFDGQIGHIDYAWSSASLTPQVTGVAPWHINADENPLFDYNDEIDDGAAEQAFEEKPDGSALVPPRVLFQPATAQRASDHDPVLLGIFAVADVSITKTLDTAGPYVPGQSITYTLVVTNAGPDPATNVQVTDTPTNLSITSVTGSGCVALPCTIPSLAVGASTNITVTATITAAGAFDNSASASGAQSDPNTANNTDNTGNGGTAAASADVSITKTDSPDPVNAGSNLTYTITVTNAGPSSASTVTLVDTLPPGTTFVSLASPGGWSCTMPAVGGTGAINCSIASLGVTSAVFTLVVNVDASVATGTVLSNTSTVTSTTSDPNTGNESAIATTTVATSADLLLSKTDSPDPVNAGSNLSYQITLTNAGPSNAANASFSDPLPAGTTFVSLSTTGSWSCTTPAVGATGTVSCTNTSFLATVDFFTLVVNVDAGVAAGTVLTNTATLTATTTDPNGANNSATATTTVGSGSADLSVTKSDTPDPVTAGNNVTYTITATNAGPSSATTVTLADTVPTGTTFVSFNAPGGWSCTTPAVGATGAINCSIPTLGVTSAVFTMVVNVDSSFAATLSNTATVSSATSDPNGGNNSDTETTSVVTSADVSVTKTDSPDPISAGSTLTYIITVANAGPSAAASVSLSDTVPAGTTFINLQSPGGWSCSTPGVGGTGTISCTIATLPTGGSAVFTLLVQTNASLATGTIITNTATVATTTTDASAGNNSATTTTTVSPVTNFTATKSVSGVFVSGTTVTYTVVLTNNMGHTQGDNFGNEFADILPAGLALTGASATSGTIVTILPSNIVTWNGSIPNGGTVTITITATITAASGTISNQGNAIIDTDNNGMNETGLPTDDPSTAAPGDPTVFTVIPANIVSATKSASGIFTPGSTVTYTVVLTNNMGIAQANNPGDELTDVLPPSLTLISATATSGTAVANVGTNTVTWNGSLAAGASVTITITAAINVGATGAVSNQATFVYDADGNGTNESLGVSDDPATGTANDPTMFNIVPPGEVTGTKSVTGSFVPGGAITYTIVLTNNMGIAQANNPGDEFTDILPPSLTLVSATATSGTALATVGTNTVTWNGSLAAGASVTITIHATIDSDVAPGTTITNQGTIFFDADGNGTNESTDQTDSASAPGSDDPTVIVVAAATLNHIPTLDQWALIALMAMLAMAALLVMKR